MLLPRDWTERIFARLGIRYGAAWLSKWKGVDEALVIADWSNELGGMSAESIAYGLANLPLDQPPTVMQFRAICLQAKRDERQMLTFDRPAPDLPRLRAELARLRATIREPHPLEWVERLRQREASGERMSAAQRDALRRMSTADCDDYALAGGFTPIPENMLPPGMREGAMQ